MPVALFRADGGLGIGDGHLSRTFSLAAALAARGWDCTLLTADFDAPAVALWQAAKMCCRKLSASAGSAQDGLETMEVGRAIVQTAREADSRCWLILDGYHFSHEMWCALDESWNVLTFDDLAHPGSPPVENAVSIVVNQNAGAENKHNTSYENAVRTLLGPRFAAIRPAVREALLGNDQRFRRRGILISIGSAERPQLSLDIATACAAHGAADVTTVIAYDVPGKIKLPPGVRWLGPRDLAPLLSTAEVAIIGGGVTALEAAYLGTPAVVLVIADNQSLNAVGLETEGACIIARSSTEAGLVAVTLLHGHPARESLINAGNRLVDGLGSERIADEMVELTIACRPCRRRRVD